MTFWLRCKILRSNHHKQTFQGNGPEPGSCSQEGNWWSSFSGECCWWAAGRVGSPVLYPQPQWGIFKETLQRACYISCRWANGGLRWTDWLLPWQSQEMWLHWVWLPPRVCRDQGWACLLRSRCEPAGRQSARNHQILPKRANCVGKETSFERSWRWPTRADEGNASDPLEQRGSQPGCGNSGERSP